MRAAVLIAIMAIAAIILAAVVLRAPGTEMKISSPVFSDGGQIPAKYTADGDNISPPLVFENIPKGTVSLAIIADDPDAPGGTFTHWLIWNLPPTLTSLQEHIPTVEEVENLGMARQGKNSFGRIGYSGPSPPPGSLHHYRFTLFALDTTLNLQAGAGRAELESAMSGHELARATLTGIYQRS
ncbi:MAG: YbhB/YbcL family Raf kinase inhibitor-like protein [Candidatus Hadarchaeales archaeon]